MMQINQIPTVDSQAVAYIAHLKGTLYRQPPWPAYKYPGYKGTVCVNAGSGLSCAHCGSWTEGIIGGVVKCTEPRCGITSVRLVP